MDFSAVSYQIAILALTILVGFIAAKTGYINIKIKNAISKIIIKIVLPCLILSSVSSKELEKELMGDIFVVFLMSVFCLLVLLGMGVITAKALKIPKGTEAVHKLLSCLGNVSFVGYPVISAMYGETGFFYAIIYWLINDLFLWTFGVITLKNEKPKSVKEVIKNLINPNTIAFTVAIIMLIFGIKMPKLLGDTVSSIGGLTISLSMIFIGMALAEVDTTVLKKWWIFVIAPLKMIIFPILFIYIFKLLGIKEILLGAVVLEAAMPAQTVLSILANESDADAEYAACGMFVTTILSLVTLPFICYMIKL
ncbi:MAG: AEC family transporter, partial [Clostridia bacterium]|nr:AEC family transporter [Clostridia bacterium]